MTSNMKMVYPEAIPDEIVLEEAFVDNAPYACIVNGLRMNDTELFYCRSEVSYTQNVLMISGDLSLPVPCVYISDYTRDKGTLPGFIEQIPFPENTRTFSLEVIEASEYKYQMFFVDMDNKEYKQIVSNIAKLCKYKKGVLKWTSDESLFNQYIEISFEREPENFSKTILDIFEAGLINKNGFVQTPSELMKTASSVLRTVTPGENCFYSGVGEVSDKFILNPSFILSGSHSVLVQSNKNSNCNHDKFRSCLYRIKTGIEFEVKIEYRLSSTSFLIYVTDGENQNDIRNKIQMLSTQVGGNAYICENLNTTIRVPAKRARAISACQELIKTFM